MSDSGRCSFDNQVKEWPTRSCRSRQRAITHGRTESLADALVLQLQMISVLGECFATRYE